MLFNFNDYDTFCIFDISSSKSGSRMKKIVIVLLFVVSGLSYSQTAVKFHFLPEGLNVIPLRASFREARIGVMMYTDNLNLKVDLGNSIDLLAFEFPSRKMRLTFGMEFMAYALATSYEGNRLQIDALDGFFGGSAALSLGDKTNRDIIRLRIIHNSAHLADGHYDLKENKWINDIKPIPFTRDFGELLIGQQKQINHWHLRYYIVPTYATLVRPVSIKKWSLSGGFEIANEKIIGELFEHKTNIFIALHSFTMGTPSYQLTTNFMTGVKFGQWNSKGVLFYLSYYYGNDIFSEYYYNRISRLGVGFFVDFN